MNTIFVMIGISGSGKSTFTRNLMRSNQVIVSRDNLRNSLFGYTDENIHEYYKRPDFKACEDKVTKFFNDQVRYALKNDMDVVADNTHLNASYINAYKQFGVEIELVWCNVDTEVAIYRDQRRTRCVGETVIRKQAQQFSKLRNTDIVKQISEYNEELKNIYNTCKKAQYDEEKPDCICVDIDGTLAHTNGKRSPYDYSNVSKDDVDEAIRDIVFQTGYTGRISIVVCSGREDSCRTETLTWLRENHIFPVDLYMRKAGDNRKDNIIKAELWREIQKNYNIIGMFDDRNRVVDMARNLGYKVMQVAEGDF